MKIIPKQLTGGRFLPLFADYIPVEGLPPLYGLQQSSRESSGKTKSSSSSSDRGSLTEKDLFSLLKDVDGLPNEVQLVAAQVQLMYRQAEAFGDEVDSSKIANMYAKSIAAIKRAKYNKEEYDTAKKTVETNKGLNEFAVDEYGRVVVLDKDGEIHYKELTDYFKNRDKFTPITNSNLLWLRAHDPNRINNNTLLNTVSNGIGMEKIDELIRTRFKSLGTNELILEGYSLKEQNRIIKGLQVLDEAMSKEVIQKGGFTLDGLYKTKVINKEQQLQAQAALQYIYKSLPENARTILLLRSGNMENPQEGALNTIMSLISSTMSSTQSITSDYEGLVVNGLLKSSKGEGKGTSKGLLDEDMNAAQMFLQGYGDHERFTINPGTNFADLVESNAVQLVNKSGESLGAGCTLLEVSKGQFGGILDWQHVTMGGRKINPINLNLVLVSDGMIRLIDFPVDENGNPDFRPTTMLAKRAAEETLKAEGIDVNDPTSRAANMQRINQVYAENGLNAVYDENGKLVGGNFRTFGVMNGTTNNRILGVDPLGNGNSLLREVEDERDIDSLIDTMKLKLDVDKYDFDKNNMGWFEGGYDMFMEGTVWIPVRTNYFNAMIGSGKEISMQLGYELELEQLMQDKRDEVMSRYNKTGPL